jgi:hypothetical protein
MTAQCLSEIAHSEPATATADQISPKIADEALDFFQQGRIFNATTQRRWKLQKMQGLLGGLSHESLAKLVQMERATYGLLRDRLVGSSTLWSGRLLRCASKPTEMNS